ncbi:MAG: hypothetical protein IK057_06565 [Clostridia bacterium]|nr:hypothetical protein [Clostridia bacterium]
MNIITDRLPETVDFGGGKYPIKTDFKVWLKFHEIITDKSKSPAEKFTDAVLCCFDSQKCKKLPDSYEETMSVLFSFFAGEPKEKKAVKSQEKVFDFTEDSEYIFTSFLAEYGIDLSESSMHWYKFLALLGGLSENSQLKKVIAWRSVNLADIENPKRRNFYRKMKEFYSLKNSALNEKGLAEELSKAF